MLFLQKKSGLHAGIRVLVERLGEDGVVGQAGVVAHDVVQVHARLPAHVVQGDYLDCCPSFIIRV